MSRYWERRRYSRGEIRAVFIDADLHERRQIKMDGRLRRRAHQLKKRERRALLPTLRGAR